MVTRPITLTCLNKSLLTIQPGSIVYGDAIKVKAADKSVVVKVKLRFVDGHVLSLTSEDFALTEFDDLLNQMFGSSVGKMDFCDNGSSPLPFSKADTRKSGES